MLGANLRGAAARFGTRAAVVRGPEVLTYGEWDRHADELAAGLRARGLGPGDRVAAVLPSGPEWAVLAAAADRAGVVLATASPALAPPERAALVELARPALVVAGPDLVEGLPLRRSVEVLAAGGRGRELARAGAPAPAEGIGDPEDTSADERPAVICFTSGTTGRPKAALFRVRHVRAVQSLDLGAAAAEWGGGGPMLASTQFAHVGMALKLPWYVRTGATLHVLERWRADDALELVARERMTTLGVVAPQLALMLRSPLMDRLDLDCVRLIIAGGAASPPALVEEARRRFGAGYSIRYSSTESGGVGLATAPDAPDDEALHTVGRPRPGVEARVVDEDDRPVATGEAGELQLRSPAVMDGYWDDPDATAAALTPDGWLRTGDLAREDDRGRLVLCGRRTEMYIRGGYNVFPSEVEAVLGTHPDVASVAVVPRADPVLGQVGVAVVVPRGDRTPDLAALREHAAGQLARHKLPEGVVVTDALPLTSVAKVDRAALERLAEQDGVPSPTEAPGDR
ncbi:MAG: class I adenylate-forming enzyme family protein [Microthrixaceae bacterium]